MTTATAKTPKLKVSKAWRKLLCSLPGYDPFLQAEGCWFDEEKAQYYIDFIETCCTHIEGALAGKPFLLENWEKAIVGNLFGWLRTDTLGRIVRRFREALVYVPRKNGKALALDTPLPTPVGWTTMGDVQPGDMLFDEFGEPCTVLEVHPVRHGHQCYRVTFSDGTSVVADAEHLWRTKTRKPENHIGTWTTEEIAATLTVGNRITHRERNHSIPVAMPLETAHVDLPIDPYVLGVWLGDGNSDDARITCSEAKMPIFEAVEAAGVPIGPMHHDRRSTGIRCRLGDGDRSSPGTSFQAELRRLGVLHNKHIPAAYLRGSIAQRMALLQGLMDTDGYASDCGQCEFTSTRIELAKGMLELARSLGMKPTIREGRAMLNGKDCGPKYRIQFFASHIPPFRLPYKLERVRYPSETARSRTRQIVSVEPIEPVPVRCIRVDSPSHLFLAGEGMIPTHNSPLIAAIANAVMFCDDEIGQQNHCAAADREQASIVFRHMKGMIEAEPEMNGRVNIYATTKTIERPDTGSYMKVLSADANTKHGTNAHLNVVDELHAQPNRELVDVLQTSMASANRIQPLMLYITTADFDRPSICNEKYAYACRVRDGIVHDPGFLPVIYEALKEDDWTSEVVWAKANPNLGISVSLDYLRRECTKAKENPAYENTFKRLHLNIITEQAERCIPMEDWDACNAEPIFSPGQAVWAGLDIGATRDFTAFLMLFQADDGEPMTVEFEDEHGEKKSYTFVRHSYSMVPIFWLPEKPVSRNPRMDDQIKAWKKQGFIRTTPGNVVDYDQVTADIGQILQPYALQQFAIDQGFQGTGITQTLQKLYGERVVAFRQGILSMAAPCREMLELMQAKRLRHGGHPVLRWMASNVAAESRGGLIKFSKDKSCEKIDGMTAAAMALGVAMTAPEAPKASVYEERGIRSIGGDD